MSFYPYWYFILFLLFACSENRSELQKEEEKNSFFGYQLSKPAEVFQLPEELEEISGLATVSGTHLLCNEDETGHLYLFNVEEGKVEKKIKWGKKGDYEGVSVLEETAYVLKSNGNIYRIKDYQSPQPLVAEIETALDSDCDAEGLTFLPGKNSLLIACKEGGSHSRSIHELGLEEGILKEEPYLEMDFSEIENYLMQTHLDKVSLELRKMLDPKGSSGVLFPSAIAFHPHTHDLYILSSKTKLLVVYADGEFKGATALDPEIYKQAESIAFAPNGDLWIGNEGKGGKANIIKLVYDQQ